MSFDALAHLSLLHRRGVDPTLAASLQVVGVMTSADGSAWSAPALAFKPDQTVYPRTSNWVGYSTPNAVVINGKVHVFVDVANDHGNDTWTQEALHHAVSADGLTSWTRTRRPFAGSLISPGRSAKSARPTPFWTERRCVSTSRATISEARTPGASGS